MVCAAGELAEVGTGRSRVVEVHYDGTVGLKTQVDGVRRGDKAVVGLILDMSLEAAVADLGGLAYGAVGEFWYVLPVYSIRVGVVPSGGALMHLTTPPAPARRGDASNSS